MSARDKDSEDDIIKRSKGSQFGNVWFFIFLIIVITGIAVAGVFMDYW